MLLTSGSRAYIGLHRAGRRRLVYSDFRLFLKRFEGRDNYLSHAGPSQSRRKNRKIRISRLVFLSGSETALRDFYFLPCFTSAPTVEEVTGFMATDKKRAAQKQRKNKIQRKVAKR